MSRKPKFRPRITQIKLNPEQVVLACACYSIGMHGHGFWKYTYNNNNPGCDYNGKGPHNFCQTAASGVSS